MRADGVAVGSAARRTSYPARSARSQSSSATCRALDPTCASAGHRRLPDRPRDVGGPARRRSTAVGLAPERPAWTIRAGIRPGASAARGSSASRTDSTPRSRRRCRPVHHSKGPIRKPPPSPMRSMGRSATPREPIERFEPERAVRAVGEESGAVPGVDPVCPSVRRPSRSLES